MGDCLAVMYTMTTYGTWLRGDERGWVDDGVTQPPSPVLENVDRHRMKHDPFRFQDDQLFDVGTMIGRSLIDRLHQRIMALTVQRWHAHFVVIASDASPAMIVKCAKDAVRWGLRPGRPIWTDGYDKRFCYDEKAVGARIEYVQRHNLELGWPARPWSYIEVPAF